VLHFAEYQLGELESCALLHVPYKGGLNLPLTTLFLANLSQDIGIWTDASPSLHFRKMHLKTVIFLVDINFCAHLIITAAGDGPICMKCRDFWDLNICNDTKFLSQ
jgi:hypothetical protein